jgi:hypothetical protein
MVAKIEERLGGLKVHLTAEPQIAGAVAATLFALDRARKKAPQGDGLVSAGATTDVHQAGPDTVLAKDRMIVPQLALSRPLV